MRVLPSLLIIAAALLFTTSGASETCPKGQEMVVVQGEDGQETVCGTPATVAKKVAPRLPRKRMLKGMVILQALVNHEGSVESVSVIMERPKDKGLAEPAIEAVRQWQYNPAIVDGQHVASFATANFKFN